MAPQGPPYNVDWLWSNISSCHVTNNREWFAHYTDFPSYFEDAHFGHTTDVRGVGNVELEIRTDAKKPGSRKILLKNVLHAPGALCNIMGTNQPTGFSVSTGGKDGSDTLRDENTNELVGLIDRVVLYKLWLKGQPKGMSSLEKGGMYVINAMWPSEEQERWNVFAVSLNAGLSAEAILRVIKPPSPPKPGQERTNQFEAPIILSMSKLLDDGIDPSTLMKPQRTSAPTTNPSFTKTTSSSSKPPSSTKPSSTANASTSKLTNPTKPAASVEDDIAAPPYTKLEKQWLKKHYQDEHHFLQSYGLKIYDEVDREERRRIARALMCDSDEE